MVKSTKTNSKSETEGIYDQYYRIHQESVDKYGINTIVLFQCGIFFELYEYYDETNENNPHFGCDISYFGEILNLVVTRKDKTSKLNRSNNPQFAGANLQYWEGRINTLLAMNYTIVIVEEFMMYEGAYMSTTEHKKYRDPNKYDIEYRQITKVLSPGTTISNTNNYNYVGAIIVSKTLAFNSNQYIYYCGLVAIDVSIGISYVYEAKSTITDPYFAIDETIRFFNTYNPKDLILCNKTDHTDSELRSMLELNPVQNIHFKDYESISKYEKIHYQNELFDRIFGNKTLVTSIDNLQLIDLENSRLGLTLLLNYIHEHDELLLRKIQPPIVIDTDKYLILENNTIMQLNIDDNKQHSGKNSCLLTLVNYTSTAIGKRLLKERILLPITDINELNKRYSQIDSVTNYTTDIDNKLKGILDFQRNQHKLDIGTLQPNDFARMHSTYKKIIHLNEYLTDTNLTQFILDNIILTKFMSFISDYLSKFNMDNMLPGIWDFFKPGLYEDIDTLSVNINTYQRIIKELAQKISLGPNEQVKVICDNLGIYTLSTTKIRYNKILTNKLANDIVIGEYTFQVNQFKKHEKDGIRISHPLLITISEDIVKATNKINKLSEQYYLEFLKELSDKYSHIWKDITSFIGIIDVAKSSAKCAKANNYIKPTIIPMNEPFIRAELVRHPIIEQLDLKSPFIPNWISIGPAPNTPECIINDDEAPGRSKIMDEEHMNSMILYSCNSVGKSSYIKSIGLSVVLAQAGFFVPASKFIYSPFRKLMTRILSNDNLFKGHSTYVVELIELRSILNRGDAHTLVCSDELANGSETNSFYNS